MIAQKSKQRSKPFAKLKREIIDRSNKRIAPEDVDNSIWRVVDLSGIEKDLPWLLKE